MSYVISGEVRYRTVVRCPDALCGARFESECTSEREADLTALEDVQNHMICAHGDYTPSSDIEVYNPQREEIGADE